MTTAELNRDIKRLAKKAKLNTEKDLASRNDKEIKEELRRLYYSDKYFRNMNRLSVLTLVRLNLAYRAIPLHFFGAHINLDNVQKGGYYDCKRG